MRSLFYHILLLLIPLAVANGQGIMIDQPKMLFNDDQTIGVFLNSNGIGADFRYARYVDYRNDRIFEFSFDYVKHPKEYRSAVAYDIYTRRFVYGKENLFWEFRGQVGNQHEIYQKYDFSSIAIRFFYSGGVSLGFQKPVYYEVVTFGPTGKIVARDEKKFDPAIHLYNYNGNASFTMGLDELKVIPGITVNTGVSFEYSEREPMIHALEAGLGATLYPRSVRIMALEESNFFFFNLYVGYRFGSMIDISESARAKSRKERRQERKDATEGVPMVPFLQGL
ncbi:MAG: hypothetical protein K9G38_07705 [Bacteroidales bacterium]|nr:hypothetical protein [Bacteroidales bacterium]